MQPLRLGLIFKTGFLVLLLCMVFGQQLNAQRIQYFPSYPFPMDIQPVLTGNFGEIRYNHFHSGIDISTFSKTGIPVHSVDSGYVSRIRVSPFGYGLAVYVNHPNDYTTVYGHLSAFSSDLQTFVSGMQQHLQSYEVDIYPEPGKFQVNKGETIAFSGNTGSSSGPHLHFEVRETDSEFPLNPLLFHLPVRDVVAPKASRIYFYNTDMPWRDAIESDALLYNSKQEEYQVKSVINLPEGEIGIGLEAFDQMIDGANHNGIYEIRLDTNGQQAYDFRMDRFSFDDSHFINAHIDYKQRLLHGKKIMLCYRQPGDFAPYYPNGNINGKIKIRAGKSMNVRIVLKDVSGNQSFIIVAIHGQEKEEKELSSGLQEYDKTLKFNDDYIRVVVPPLALYYNAPVVIKKAPCPAEAVSLAYRIGNVYIPIQHYFDIILKNPEVPDSLKSKILLIRLDHKNRRIASRGKWVGGDFYGSSRAFGTFYLASDQRAPVITPLSKSLSAESTFRYKLSDNLAGVQYYEVRLDGQWILAEYSGKSHTLSCKPGKLPDDMEHILEIIVKDYVGNERILKQTIKNKP